MTSFGRVISTQDTGDMKTSSPKRIANKRVLVHARQGDFGRIGDPAPLAA